MVHIYALTDPITNQIRYIGKSERVKGRYRDHLNDQSKTHKVNWIKGLKNKGLLPGLIILEEVPENVSWEEREIFWISQAKENGWNLVNSTSGGDGVRNITGDGKRRMLETWTGRKHKPETLIKLSAASKGRKHREETKVAMSKLMTGRKILWVDKVKKAVSKFDEEKIGLVLEDLKTMKVKDVAAKYKVHRTTITKIKLGTYFQQKSNYKRIHPL